MKVFVEVDGAGRTIDTRDPETLARWLGEIFASFEATPSTYVRVQVWPGWAPGGQYGEGVPDWIADSRIITRHSEVKTPREFVAMLQDQITDYEQLQQSGA